MYIVNNKRKLLFGVLKLLINLNIHRDILCANLKIEFSKYAREENH